MNRSDVIVRLAVARGLLAEQAAPGLLKGYSQAVANLPDRPPIEQWMVESGELAPLQAARLRDDFLHTQLQCSCGWMGSGRDTGGDRDGGCPQCHKAGEYWPMIPASLGDDSAGTLPSDRQRAASGSGSGATLPSDRIPVTREQKRMPSPPAHPRAQPPSGRRPAPQPQSAAPRPGSGVRPPGSGRHDRPISGDDVEIPYSPDAIPPGTVLSDWRIEAKVGSGAIGVVYRAADTTLDRPVAIKVLAEDVLQNATVVTRFKNEARALARLDHPNVLQIYRFGHVGGRPYLVMQWVDGESLAERLKRAGAPEPEDAVRWLAQAARGLEAAHSQRIIHRDVKPENVMLTRTGVVKVADFGLAKEVDSDVRISRTGAFMGTPAYVAPEQIDGAPDLDPRADVYSLGITAFELLTGKLPFKAKSLVQLLYAHSSEELPSMRAVRPDIPPKLEQLIQRMTAKQPDHRPTMKEVADTLEQLKIGVLERDDAPARPVARYEPPSDSGSGDESPVAAERRARPQSSSDYYRLDSELDDREPDVGFGSGSGSSSSGGLPRAERQRAREAHPHLAGRSGHEIGEAHKAKKKRRGCVGLAVAAFVWLLVIALTASLAFAIWWVVEYRRVPTMQDIERLKFWEYYWNGASEPTSNGTASEPTGDGAGDSTGSGTDTDTGTDGDDPLAADDDTATLIERIRTMELLDARPQTGRAGVLLPEWFQLEAADTPVRVLRALQRMIIDGTREDARRGYLVFVALDDAAAAHDVLHTPEDIVDSPRESGRTLRDEWAARITDALDQLGSGE